MKLHRVFRHHQAQAMEEQGLKMQNVTTNSCETIKEIFRLGWNKGIEFSTETFSQDPDNGPS